MSLLNKDSSSTSLWCAPEDLLLPSSVVPFTPDYTVFPPRRIPFRWRCSNTGRFNSEHRFYRSCHQMHHCHPHNVIMPPPALAHSLILSFLPACYCYFPDRFLTCLFFLLLLQLTTHSLKAAVFNRVQTDRQFSGRHCSCSYTGQSEGCFHLSKPKWHPLHTGSTSVFLLWSDSHCSVVLCLYKRPSRGSLNYEEPYNICPGFTSISMPVFVFRIILSLRCWRQVDSLLSV